MMSLTPTPMPPSGPAQPFLSACPAWLFTLEASNDSHAPIAPSVAAMRASCDSASASAVSLPAAIASRASRIESVMIYPARSTRHSGRFHRHAADRLGRRGRQEQLEKIVLEAPPELGCAQSLRVRRQQ